MSALQILRAGRDRIASPDSWCQGTLRDSSGRRCALGALPMHDSHSYSRAWNALAQALPDGYLSVADFNDHDDTTHNDVLALYDRAIAALEAEDD